MGFTYTQLKQALQDWPQNTSSGAGEYVPNLDNIIGLGELRLVKDLNLDIFDQIDFVAIAQGDVRATKPVGWVTTRGLWRYTGTFVGDPTGARTPLHQRSMGFIRAYAADNTLQAPPIYFNEVSATEFEFQQPADAAYTFEVFYVVRPTGLSSGNQHTWFGDNLGDVLFAACLMEAEHFIKADDRYADFKAKYGTELLPTARAELRTLIRTGDYDPAKAAAVTE